MNNKFTIEAILKASGADQFSKDFQNATKSMDGIGRASKKSTGGLKSFMGGVGKIAGAIGVTKLVSAGFNAIRSSVDGAVSRVDTLNQFPKVLQQMGASGEDADRSIARLSDGIQGLPTTLDGVAGTAQRMFTILGDIDLATESTLALNNAFLASGASQADASRGLEQYTQMLSTGKVDMQSWRTLQETMPYALKETAEAFGFTGESATNDFYAALQSGEITMDEMNEKIIELSTETGGFAETALEASKGLATSWQNIKTAIVTGTANIIQAINEWMEDAGLGGIAENFDKVKVAVQGAFSYIVENIPVVMNGITGLFDTVKNSTAFQTLKEVISNVIEIGKELIQQFLQSDAWANFKGLMGDVAQAILDIDFGQVLQDVGEFIDKWSPLILGIMGAIGAFKLLSPIIPVVAGAFKAFSILKTLISAVGLLQTGFTLLAPVMFVLTSPITLIAGAIAALVGVMVYLYNTNETVREAIDTAWQFIKDLIMQAVAVISEYVQSVIGGLVTWWQENNEMILQAAQNVWNAIKTVIEVVMNVISSIMQTVWPMIMAVVKFAWDGIKNIIDGTIKVITGIIEFFSALFTGNWSAMWDAVKQIVSGAVQAVWGFIQLWIVGKIIGAVKAFAGLLKSLFSSAWTFVKNVFSSSLSFISGKVSSVFGAIKGVISTVMNTVRGVISNVLGSIKGTFSNIFNSLRGIVSGAFGKVTSAVRGGMTSAWNTVTGFLGKFKTAGSNIVGNIAKGITGAIGKVTDAIGSVTQKIADFLPNSPPKDKSSPLRNLHKHAIGEEVARGIYDGESEIQRAMNRALDVDMPMVNGQVQHEMNNNLSTQPAYINVNIGGQNFRGFVENISNEQGRMTDLEMQF